MRTSYRATNRQDTWRLGRAVAVVTVVVALVVGAAGGSPGPSPLFVLTNFMTVGRQNATATLLANGKVLVTGGQDSTGAAGGTAELYDPATARFTFVNVMATARKSHAAAMLNNGKVLITGGIDNNGNVLNTAEVFDPGGTFTQVTGTMSDSRQGHTATALPNGQVLIAGGKDSAGSIVNTAEIFDPARQTFTALASTMSDSRLGHTATLLNDGSVLITGGRNNSGTIVNSAQRFFPGMTSNPGAGVFKPTGSMTDLRANHTATLLSNGKVLIAGGADGLDVLGTAEIYDPSSGSFQSTTDSRGAITVMTSARQNHTATLLKDGTVLLAGGSDNSGNLPATAEVYNPSSGDFFAVGNPMKSAHAGHIASLLDNGMVLVAGGISGSAGSSVNNEAELYDPGPGFFVPTGTMAISRQFSTASALFVGSTLIAGGQNAVGSLASTEVYDGATFSPGPNLTTPRAFHTATAFPKFLGTTCSCNDQHVLLVGGVDNTGTVHNDADLYDVFFNLMLTAAPGGFPLNKMSHPRLGHTATVLAISGQALFAGGMTTDGSVLNNADVFNPVGNTFTASAGTMASSRVFHTATQLLDFTVLLAGGRDTNGNILSSAELYNPGSDGFVAVSPMTDAREFHTATMLSDGQVLIAGGINPSGALATAEIYNSATKTFTAVGRMAVARYLHSAVLLPDGEVLIAAGQGNNNLVINRAEIYNPETATFRPAPNLMLGGRVGQAAAMLQSGLVLFAGGVDSAFNVTASAELFDPPSGPAPAGVLVTVAKIAKATGSPSSLVNAGRIQALNVSGSTESFDSVTVRLSNPAIFSQLALTGQVTGKSQREAQSAVVKNPGATVSFSFKRPLSVPPGGSVSFTLTGALGSLRRAGASRGRAVRSVQAATVMDVSRDSESVQAQGLPAGFGAVTLR